MEYFAKKFVRKG